MTLLITMIVLLVVLTLILRLGGFILGLWAAGVVGWVANIITIFHGPAMGLWQGQEILRMVGVFIAPLGAVLGYF